MTPAATVMPAKRQPYVPAAAQSIFLQRWGSVALIGAVMLSTVDGLLLQRRKSFFTGGFLTEANLQGAADMTVFLAVSLLVDAAVVGLIAAVVMWALCRARIGAAACTVAGLLAGLGLPLLTNILSYKLVQYLGDALDWSLMFDVAGQSPAEVLAVSSSHLVAPSLLLAGAGSIAGCLLWLVNKYCAGPRQEGFGVRVLTVPLLLAIAGLAGATITIASSDVMESGLRRKPAGAVLALVADEVTDLDRDGYGLASRLSDPDSFNGAIFPYAADIPGNGVDEDGVGGDLPEGSEPYADPPVSSAPWQRRPDVVLVVLESFRADLVGSRYEGRQVTPVLDAIAARGISAPQVYSHNGYTAPSRRHIFSGSLTGREDRTLIDDFKANGYLVAYFSGQDESFGGPAQGVGFERADVAYDARVDRMRRYSTFTTAGSLAVPFGVVQERVGAFLKSRGAADQPLFLYVNLHDTHFPYWHSGVRTLTSAVRLPRHRIVPEQRDALWATYTNTAANVDHSVGEILNAVRRTRGTEPAIIVTADHGESLFDENFLGHGHGLNDAQTQIPLIVSNLPMVVRRPFGQAELRPAIGAALRMSADVPAVPRVQASDDDARVFQYLGSISRPRQIAFLQEGGRIIYDFRTQRVQAGRPQWRLASELSESERSEFLTLIHFWERIRLAERPDAGNEY